MNAQVSNAGTIRVSLPLALAVAAALFAVTLQPVQAAFTTVDLDGDARWDVEYLGRSYDANLDQTTFSYRVTVNDNPALSHFTLGLHLCDPMLQIVSTSPAGGSLGLDPTTGVYGVKWDIGLDPGQTRDYSITVAGDVGEDDTTLAVKAGLFVALGVRPGPSCDGEGGGGGDPELYDIYGTVFLDADRDAFFDDGEPVFPDVTVYLCDALGTPLALAVTDANGDYAFLDLPEGNYQVKVMEATEADDFNEILFAYFDPTTVVVRPVSLFDMNSVDNDFGFVPDGDEILDDFDPEDPDHDDFVFAGTGRTIGFWKHQLSVALNGRGRAQVSAGMLSEYVQWIEGFYLVDPFQFADDFADAFAVLSSTSSMPVDLLSKQLLGSEFNEAAGWGLEAPYDALQTILLQWGEYLVSHAYMFTADELIEAKDVFDAINNSGE